MKKNLRNILGLSALIGLLTTSCVNDSFADPVVDECIEPSLVKNKEVSDIYNTAVAPTSTMTPYANEDIIEAVVTSSDEGGNFFKTVSLMSLDGSRGFSMSIDDYNLYTQNLQPGKKVYIKMKGLYTARPTGGTIGLNFGGAPSGSFNTLQRLGATVYKNYIIPTCKLIDEETFVKHLTLSQVKNDAYLNTLVEIDNVEFESTDVTFGNNPVPSTNPDKNEYITDGTSFLAVRTSKFANFAGKIVPKEKGKIRGVLTKFNSDYQFIVRTERDIKFTSPRIDYFAPIVGATSTNFNATLNENFTSFAVNNKTFPTYINDADNSSRYWSVKNFSGNNFIEMTSFGSSGSSVTARAFFMVPVNFTAANSLTFKKLARFYRGGTPLKVYYISSADYSPGSVVDTTKLTDITSSFTSISYPALGSSETSFASAGTYNLPTTLTGNGYFIFEYTGDSFLTSTVQIDDIVIN